MSYTNADGLFVLTNGAQGAVNDEGVTARGARQVITKKLSLAGLASSFGSSNIDPLEAMIPAGAIIVNADLVITDAATSGGSATLTIGTYNAAGTAVDADGIDAAIALAAIDADGDVVQCNGDQVSGVVTVGSAPVYIGALYGTAAFTAGEAVLIVEYIKVE
jgi:hypothetical protein